MQLRAAVLSGILGVASLWGTAVGAKENDLAAMQDQSAKISVSNSWKCAKSVKLTIEAAEAPFFETRLSDLGSLFGAALSKLSATCAKLEKVSIDGKVKQKKLIESEALKSNGWRLQLDHPNLTKEAMRIPEVVKGYGDLWRLRSMFAPYLEVAGIERTAGYSLFAQQSQNTVLALTSDGRNFQHFVEELTLEKDHKVALEKIEDALGIVQHFEPNAAVQLRQRVPVIQSAALRNVAMKELQKALVRGEPIAATASALFARLERKTPDQITVSEIDRQLATWIEAEILEHEKKAHETELEEARSHLSFLKGLDPLEIGSLLPESQTAVETASLWFEEVSSELLDENVKVARELILESGSSYEEADLILETGLVLFDEFSQHGFNEEAGELLDFAKLHLQAVIAKGLEPFAKSILAEHMTLERVAYWEDQTELFFNLSQDFPGFTRYVNAIEDGIQTGRDRVCKSIAQELETGRNRDVQIGVADEAMSLTAFTCNLYRNGHLLKEVSISLGGKSGRIELLQDGSDFVTFNISVVDERTQFRGESDDWDDTMGTLVIPPPSGKPDRNGVTECDLLAGDPNDEMLRVEGVNLELVDVDYDFDRAVEACIAAVEHDAAATRQVYQLARLLEFLGDTESAAYYAEIAAGREYAPAIHLQAFSILTNREDDDAFFDAVDLLKVSSELGYAPSKKELNEMLPPGVDLYREIPPPSDDEILAAVGRERCEANIAVRVCSTRTGVARKNCFQTGEGTFSCELVLRHRCNVETVLDGDPLMRMFSGLAASGCGPTTDTMFMKLTKRGNGWSARSEF